MSWKSILKVAGAGIVGSILANEDAIRNIGALVPAKYQPLIGAAITIAAVFVRSPREGPAPQVTQTSELPAGAGPGSTTLKPGG